MRAATLARICRGEGGYARPDLPLSSTPASRRPLAVLPMSARSAVSPPRRGVDRDRKGYGTRLSDTTAPLGALWCVRRQAVDVSENKGDARPSVVRQALHRLPWFLALVLVASAVLIAVSVWILHNPWTDALPFVAVVAVGAVINPLITQGVQGRRWRRQIAQGVVEGSFRVSGDTVDHLDGRWRSGELHLARGRVRFVPMYGGLRFAQGKPVDFTVVSVGRPGRQTRWGLHVPGGLPIIEVRAARGTLEIAVQPGFEDAVVDRLTP